MELRGVERPQFNPQVHCLLLCPRATCHLSPSATSAYSKLDSVRKPHIHGPWILSTLISPPHLTEAQALNPKGATDIPAYLAPHRVSHETEGLTYALLLCTRPFIHIEDRSSFLSFGNAGHTELCTGSGLMWPGSSRRKNTLGMAQWEV